MSQDAIDPSRRAWVGIACGAGAVGAAAVAVPFVSSFAPSERAKAAGAAVEVDISALKPGEMKTVFDETTEARGLKKGHVIEEALVQYLHALRELPADVFVPSRVVLTEASGHEVLDSLSRPQGATQALRALMAGEDGDDVPS